MKNKGAKQKLKRKGAASAFGCDLTEYLESSGQDVPYVLKSCAEFIETHGIVDGIYRLSGITSNIQRLRQEFGSDQCPDLTREVYLQDIHCVGSLCKLYFRELPNPLLTYELYEKFTEAVSHRPEEGQLARIQNVILELPPPHYRTLEYLIRHLAHIASFSSKTNMHARNLALVWAPNLLRSKKIEATICNGDAAFLAVRVQQVVIEFILNHADQIFNGGAPGALQQDGNGSPPPGTFPANLASLITLTIELPNKGVWEQKAGKVGVPGQAWLHREPEASLRCYVRHCLKQVSEGRLGYNSEYCITYRLPCVGICGTSLFWWYSSHHDSIRYVSA